MDNLKFFKEHINNELESSKAYAKKALELIDICPRIARRLMEISSSELRNSESMYAFMGEYNKAQHGNSEYSASEYNTVYSDALADYLKTSGEIKAMMTIYEKRS